MRLQSNIMPNFGYTDFIGYAIFTFQCIHPDIEERHAIQSIHLRTQRSGTSYI